MINPEQIKGNWKQFKGHAKKHLGKLTDDDLLESEGKSEILIGKLAERYGITKEKAEEKWQQFLAKYDESGNEIKSIANDIMGVAEDFSEHAIDALKECQQYAKEKPLAAAGIALLAGLVLGMLITRS